ncbi:MAG: hypothetical protein AAFN16_15185 [Pseudomonadota bacterium]
MKPSEPFGAGAVKVRLSIGLLADIWSRFRGLRNNRHGLIRHNAMTTLTAPAALTVTHRFLFSAH